MNRYKWLTFLPLSIASMRASVSLLRMQSMSCRWDRSPAESLRRNPDSRLLMLEIPALGRAFRPSNSKTNKRSTSLMVSKEHLHINRPDTFIPIWSLILHSHKSKHKRTKCIKNSNFIINSDLSSPRSPLSMASGKSDRSRSCVIVGDPRQSVDRRLITVEILGLDLASWMLTFPGVLAVETLGPNSPACWSRCSNSSIRPCWARGAGSTPRRVKRSAREAKHRRAPSATCQSKQRV